MNNLPHKRFQSSWVVLGVRLPKMSRATAHRCQCCSGCALVDVTIPVVAVAAVVAVVAVVPVVAVVATRAARLSLNRRNQQTA